MVTEYENTEFSDDMMELSPKEAESLCKKWLKEISFVQHSKEQKTFEAVGEKIVKKYKNSSVLVAFQASDVLPNTRVMFNVLWSIVQVLKPSLFCRLPKVVVERRFKDQDPIGRLASQIAERGVSYMLSIQQDRLMHAGVSAVEDRLLPGRGTVWLRYEMETDQHTDDVTNVTKEIIKPNSEMVWVDYVYWKDYLEAKARNPYETRWRARRFWMTRSELAKEFGEDIAKNIKFESDNKYENSDDDKDIIKETEVWLIADYDTKRFIWVSEGYKDAPLKVVDNPYRLKDFFPSPVPLLATTTTDSTYPTPDFVIYERLADELDYITQRLSSIVALVRVVGMHAASLGGDIKNMMMLNDGQTWPVDNWQAFMEQKGGLQSAIAWFPFEQAVSAIPVLQQYQQQLLDQIFEVTGIPDIVRGMSDPTETATAQQMKGKWTSIKLQDSQQDVQRFWREVIAKVSEIMFEPQLFTDQTWSLMSGASQMTQEDQQNFLPALQLLRDDRLRTFRVDIETDSTIALDEDQEIARWSGYMQMLQSVVQEVQSISQFRPELMHPIIESAKATVRSLRTGRSVEASWDNAWQQIEDNDAQAQQQPPPPDYEMMRVENEQAKIQVAQLEAQIKQQEAQFTQWFKPQELQANMQAQMWKNSAEVQKLELEGLKINSKAQIDQMLAELKMLESQMKAAIEKQYLDVEKVKVAVQGQESLLEEARLAREESRAEREEIRSKIDSKDKIPQIHIHNGSGKKQVKISRSPTGELVGVSENIE